MIIPAIDTRLWLAWEVISKAIDKLPEWGQIILTVSGIAVGGWEIAHYGWSFIWRAIFSPEF